MSRRAFIVVLDAVGAGELPDAAEFGDEGSNTLGNVATRRRRPATCRICRRSASATCCRSRAARRSPRRPRSPAACSSARSGKDTTVGPLGADRRHHASARSRPTRDGFPQELLDAFAAATGRGVIGNVAASGTEIIQRLGEEHQRTGKWIVYTSADSVFQIAAHEETVPLEELYAACRAARGLLTGEHAVARVIARPVRGRARRATAARRTATTSRSSRARPELPLAHPRGRRARDGRRQDQRHLRRLRHRRLAPDEVERRRPRRARSRSRASGREGLVFVNLVETDMTYGHRNDPEGFHRCLQEIDAAIPDLRAALGPDDLLVLTSDHGCDPTTPRPTTRASTRCCVAHVPGHGARRPPRRRVRRRRRDGGGLARARPRATACRARRSRCESRRADRAQARRRRARAGRGRVARRRLRRRAGGARADERVGDGGRLPRPLATPRRTS